MAAALFFALHGGMAFAAASSTAPDTTQARLEASGNEPQNWITHHGSLSGQRFSSLSQINKGNVKDLKLAFTYWGKDSERVCKPYPQAQWREFGLAG